MFVTKINPKCYPSNPWDWSLGDRLKRLGRGQDKRIAYFYETPDSSTFRYRVYNMIQALEASPNGSTASFFCSADLDRTQAIAEMADILVVCRSRYTPDIDRLICSAQSKGKKVFFDIDDLVFDPSYVNLILDSLDEDTSKPEILNHWFGLVGRIGATFRLCDAAIATNCYLAEKMRQFSGKETRVIPNFLNREQMHISDRIFHTKSVNRFERTGTLSIGYFSGSPTHDKDFRIVISALRDILDTYSEVSLRVVGYLDLQDELLGHHSRIEYVPFQDFINLQGVIGSTEINIAPFQDNDFTNCKSELKYFEAAAVGTVTVASPTYTFARTIDHGNNGYLANSYQWFDALQKVIESMDQVEGLAYRARDHAREKYGWVNQWKAIEEALLDRPESQPVIRTSPQIALDSSSPRSRATVDSTSASADRAAKNLSAVDPSGAASW